MLLRICPDNAHREQGMAQVLCSPPTGFSELPLEGVSATGERGSAKAVTPTAPVLPPSTWHFPSHLE